MSYHALYILFGIIFFGGIISYWIVSRALRNPKEIYIVTETAPEPGKSTT